ncbi:MAG: hypothetical protein C4320_09510, partial [Armatimonadota bacterium]
PRFDGVAEASFDLKAADEPQILEYGTAVGPNRPLALRFGSLDSILPPGARVVGATLILAAAEGQPIRVRSIRRLSRQWRGAGPNALVRRLRPDEKKAKRGSATLRTPGRDL